MADSTVKTAELEQRSAVRFGPLDDLPRAILRADDADEGLLRRHLALSERSTPDDPPIADVLLRLRTAEYSSRYVLAAALRLDAATREQVQRTVIHAADDRLAITDVVPVDGRVMSERPFTLRVHFAAAALNPPRLVSIRVAWRGEPYVNEVLLSARDVVAGYVDVPFEQEQSLPTGPAEFTVSLFSAAGASARFTVTYAVLPSNPFALQLGPDQAFVTGTWSARGVRHGDAYDTGVSVTLLNGDAAAVQVQPGFHWRFWDGGVGGSLVEEGNGSFGGGIAVSGFSTWRGWISFHSPSGSGIFNHYQDRNDMTIELTMTRTNGESVTGTITARTMFRFGVNVTRVSGEDFTGQEWADLFTAAARTRTIYERRDLTFDTDDRFIPAATVGGFEIIDSYGEFHDLLADWSGPDTNQNIDAFIVQAISVGGGVDGIDGSVPGPTSHGGGDSGLIASKTGYIDESGMRRLHAAYLGMLIGHELGHYLGLDHTNDAGNLMLPSSGTDDINLSYGQYQTMIRHGWVRID